ncbi:MAG TPA: methyl-accepting chemotaxis protein [Verrucomicrobiae bacterium]
MKNLKLSTKLILGFGIITAIAVALGLVGYYGAARNAASITEVGVVRLPSVETILTMKEAATSMKSIQRTLLQRDIDAAMRQRQYTLAAEARRASDEARRVYEPLPQTVEEAALWKEFVPVWEQWQKANEEFLALAKELDALKLGDPIALERDLATFRGQHFELQMKVLASCSGGPVFEGGADHTACAFGKWRAAHQNVENPELAAALNEIDTLHQKFHEAAGQAREKIVAGDLAGAKKFVFDEMEKDAKRTFELFGRMQQTAASASALFDKLNHHAMQVCRPPQLKAADLLDKIAAINVQVGHSETDHAVHFSGHFKLICLVTVLVGLILSAVITSTLTRSITRPIRAVADALSLGAEQTASAAGQVSSASQSLAEGASEQAASIEETSASIEEMSSMTKRNAENAQRANELARQARAAAERGTTDMQAMNIAMDAIKASSDDIAKIIKTIDEIAFQTNLLALNAAVEAARAGEAGMGFAVVADEVRNLAQRAAQAAKETSGKIEGAIRRSAQGVEISTKVAQALTEIVTQARQVDELAAEVASASREQSQGIAQVNMAVSQMDKVTQSNAANAEESAAAAEELNAQAETMKEAVQELLRLVDSTRQTTSSAEARPARNDTLKKATTRVRIPAGTPQENGRHETAPAAAESESAPARGNARSAIPLESAFRDF